MFYESIRCSALLKASFIMTTRAAVWRIISVVPVCMSVKDNNFRKPWRSKFILAHPVYLQGIGSRSVSYMKVIGSRSRSQEQKGQRFIFPQCKTSIGNNYGSITQKATKFVCSMGFSAMADWMVWPPFLSRDRKWPRLAKCTHLRVVDDFRLEGKLVQA